MTLERSGPRVVIAAACAFFVACVVRFAIEHWDSIYDDAFIYLRYARNLESGCGLRFNCADAPVEGFTSPIFLAILWGGSLVTDQLIWLTQVIGVVGLAGAGVLAILTGARFVDAGAHRFAPAAIGVAVAVVLGLDDFVTLNAVIGLESSLAAAAFALIGFAAITDRPRLLLGAACISVLLRPEGAVFVLALPLIPSMRRVRLLALALGFFVVLTAVRYALFGALLPNTFYAKSGGTLRHAVLGAEYLVDCVRDFPLIALAPLSLVSRKHRRACVYLLAAAAAWALFFLRSGGDTFEYSRLMFPLVPMLSALAIAGLFETLRRYSRISLAFAATGVVAVSLTVRAMVAHGIPEQHANPRVVEWAAAGSYLRNHYPRGTLIATVPIGAIGYYSSLPLLDLVGLTEPAIARAGRSVPEELLTKRWIAHERHNTEHVLARAPGVIVTTMVRDRPWRTLAEARAGFWADWLLLQEIKAGRAPYHVRDAEIATDRHMLLLERNP